MSEDLSHSFKKRQPANRSSSTHSLARPLKKLLQVFVEQRHPPAGGEGQLEPLGKPFADRRDTGVRAGRVTRGEGFGVWRRDSLRQHRLDEVLLQLLVDELELAERLLTPDDAIVDAHHQVVQLRNEPIWFYLFTYTHTV